MEGCRPMEADLRNSVSVVNAQMEEVLVGRIGCGGVSCNFLGARENITQPVPLALHLVQNIPNCILRLHKPEYRIS